VKGNLLPTGKLHIQILSKLLRQHSQIDKRVLLGPGIGEDAAAIDVGDKALVVTTDPITFATDEIGYYSVIVNANDIATTGADPKWYTVSILLPEGVGTEDLVNSIFRQIHQACNQLNITVVGGHTETTHGLDRPILVGQMIGEVEKRALVTTAGAKPGDDILLSKGICIEGTSLIAREKGSDLVSRGISKDLVENAQRFLYDPGISIVEEARLAFRVGQVHAMHDITEGGLADGLYELSIGAGVRIEVEKNRIPVYAESQVLCDALGLNTLGVIASGSLLITASPPVAERILEEAQMKGLALTKIGHVEAAGSPSVTMLTPNGREPVPYFDRDEVVRIFEQVP
jgi:hydrogenase expression/formation protein HypE